MGVDISHNKERKFWCKEHKSWDIFLDCWSRYTDLWPENQLYFQPSLLKRFMSCTNRLSLSFFLMIWKTNLPGCEGKIAVIVRIISNDVRVQRVPKLKVCALCVSSRARSHILKVEGKILVWGKVALDSLDSCGSVLLPGPHKG